MATDPLTAVRDIALAFPEATEQETWGRPTFRVGNKIFVSYAVDDVGASTVTVKAAPGEQDRLLAEGAPFFVPEYLGAQGWVGLVVDDDTDWRAVGELIADSYREVAPRRLAAGIGLRPAPRGRGAAAVVAVGNVIGELVEGKPSKEQTVVEQEADDDLDDGLSFDEDDPRGTTLEL